MASPGQETTDASMRHSDLITPWSARAVGFDPSSKLETRSLASVLDDYMPQKGGWLSDEELAAIEVFKQEMISLNDRCEKKGGYTREAAAYYDKLISHEADKARELWDSSKK